MGRFVVSISLPQELNQYLVDNKMSPSEYVQSKIKEDIIKSGLQTKYNFKG